MPLPPNTYDGRTNTGYPILSAISAASSYELAIPNCGAVRLLPLRISPKAPRSSAKSMASGDVPRIFTPASFKPRASPNGVCPPS